jgi:hypothetical protein
MKSMPKPPCKMIIFLTAIVLLASSNVMAGGGKNWNVTVVNNTKHSFRVTVCVTDAMSLKCEPHGEQRRRISKNQSGIRDGK